MVPVCATHGCAEQAFRVILPEELFAGHITRVLVSGGALLGLDTFYFRHTKVRLPLKAGARQRTPRAWPVAVGNAPA